MTQQAINVGTVANDGTGDPIRTAFQKANANFTELYAGGGVITGDRFVMTSVGINAQVGAGYQLQSTDNGKIITLDNIAPIALTCPAGLGSAFSCVIIQLGAGQVGVAAGFGATLNSFSGLVNLAGQYASANIIAVAADTFVLMGQTA